MLPRLLRVLATIAVATAALQAQQHTRHTETQTDAADELTRLVKGERVGLAGGMQVETCDTAGWKTCATTEGIQTKA